MLREKLHHVQACWVGECFEATCRALPREFRTSIEAHRFDTFLQIKYVLDDGVDGSDEGFVSSASWIFEPPVLAVLCGERGAHDSAAHGDKYVGARKHFEWFWALGRNVDTVMVAQYAQGILVDLFIGACAC